MAQDRYTDQEQDLFERELERRLREELPNVREEEIKAAARRAAERELEFRRESLREQLESEVVDTTTESPVAMREEANREAPSKLLIGIVLLILLLFLLAVLGRLPGMGNSAARPAAANASGPLTPQLGGDGPVATPVAGAVAGSQIGQGNPDAGAILPPGTLDPSRPPIGDMFLPFYQNNGGLRIFGYPLSPVVEINGRLVQWFERSRLEYWPENPEPYTVQPGLVGLEYTDGRDFPTTEFFANTDDRWFFPETSHSVQGAFLRFWIDNGGVSIFGFPISEVLVEVEPDTNRWKTVQYFQRARFELNNDVPDGHPERVQLGLLGRALYLNEEKSRVIAAPEPTPVPLP
jgi:hypothetical protein